MLEWLEIQRCQVWNMMDIILFTNDKFSKSDIVNNIKENYFSWSLNNVEPHINGQLIAALLSTEDGQRAKNSTM